MSRAPADEVRDLLTAAGAAMGRRFDVGHPAGITLVSKDKADVADSTQVFVVRARPRRDDAVLILSPPGHPDSVDQSVAGADSIVGILPDDLARTVLLPEYRGRHDGRSFAIYPRMRPLSRNRLVCFVQKRLLRRGILDWTLELAACSRQTVEAPEALETRFLAPLEYLAGEAGLSDDLRRAADGAAGRIRARAILPVSIVQHGDLWLENVLLERTWPMPSGRRFPFSVIDWGTANPAGYPFIDFLRYALSSTRDAGWTRAGLRAQRDRLGMAPEALLPHVCAGVGWLGLHRDQFPHARFLSLAETVFTNARHFAT